ncbi:MAG: thermosome subunit alpha [Halanaeroarchaeum sp.]
MSESNAGQRLRGAGQPMFILSEDSERTQGKDARSSNISAGKAVAESVRTTLGPRGMDKMLVNDSGDVVITNDGATILDEMDIEHPAAQMLVEVADAQEEEVGDGTTTAAVLAGQLLSEGEEFLDRDIHPTTIAEGYSHARDIALDALEDVVVDDDLSDEILEAVATASMTGKGTGGVTAESLASDIVSAVRTVQENGSVNRGDIQIVARSGESSSATRLVDGVIIDESPIREDMRRSVSDASIAVVDAGLETRETEIDVEFDVQSADQLDAAVESEQRELEEYANALADAGVDVAFVTGDVADATAVHLANAGVLAFDSVDDDTVQSIVNATGARRLPTVDDIEDDDLGAAESVRLERFGDDEVTFVEGGAKGDSVSLFVRGGTGHSMDELERAVQDGVDGTVAALVRGGVVPGAAATEVHLANAVRDAAAGIEGRQQLAVEAFAEALDAIPRTLAENAGMDPIDGLVDVRAANESDTAGIVVDDGDAVVADPTDYGVYDPVAVKREILESATEAATMIVRIDDVISAE